MFYQCQSCRKIWQYPIEKCPDCFLPLERLTGKEMKVIGVSRVEIPSILHPQTPYFVLLLKDENGNQWVQKSVEEYKIGDEFQLGREKNKEGVAIWRIKYDYLEAIEKSIDLLEGLELKENSKVLILPSLFEASHPYFRDNTNPEFLEAILNFLQKKDIKPSNIFVSSQSFNEIPIEIKAQKSGLLDVCLKNQITPVDLAKTNFIKKENLEISEIVLNSDLILNLPILKMTKAMASENIFFLLKKENYLSQKYLFSEKEIFEKLKQILPSCLTLAEANIVQDEKGFNQFLGLLFASFNPQNLDRVFLEITRASQLPEILENINLEKIPIFGRKIAEIII